MINLLPPSGKKRVIIDYWIRVVSIFFTLVGISFLFIGALLLPTYFYLSFQAHALDVSELNLSDDVMSFQELEDEINIANDISNLLTKTQTYIEASQVIEEIKAFAGERIFVSNISIEKKDGQIIAVKVNGAADDRNALVQFRDNAEASEFFSEVDLPLSNLAQDRDIPFSLSLEPSETLQTAL